MTYDALMRIQALTVTDPGGTLLLNYAYTYDPIGNIQTKTTEHGNYAYGYDAASRLTSADNPVLAGETYTYDNVGNRTTASGVSGSIVHNENNELRLYGEIEYQYDANGNMTQKKVGTAAVNYIYNAENRLVQVEDDLTKVVMAEYGYDPFGRRLWKDVQGVRTYFFYSEEGLIAEYDANGNELRSYGYKPDSTWTTDPLWLKQGGQYYFYQNDHLGTPHKLVAQNGAVMWSASYEAFGSAHVEIETVTNNLRFPGQYYDAETGLHYNFQRYYDPGSGRYVQTDLIGHREGKNLFSYALNNPGKETDALGLWVHPPQVIPPQEAWDVVFSANWQFDLAFGEKLIRTYLKKYEKFIRLIDDPMVQFLQSPEARNGLFLAYLAYSNWPGGMTPDSHNRFVFTCKYGWIDVGHFFQTATLSYWSRVAGFGASFDTVFIIAGEILQLFILNYNAIEFLPDLPETIENQAESALTPEDLWSNFLGTQFGSDTFNGGLQNDVVKKWYDVLVESGALKYKKESPIHKTLQEDADRWWNNGKGYTGEYSRYTGPRRHWEMVKCGANGYKKSKAYCVYCCCNPADCPGSCQDKPVEPDYRF